MASSNALLPPVEHKRAGAVDIVLGAQWGDEAKGKLVDVPVHTSTKVAAAIIVDGLSFLLGERHYRIVLFPFR